MAFSFGFLEQDLDNDLPLQPKHATVVPTFVEAVPPKSHQLSHLLRQFIDLTLSVEMVVSASGNVTYKRPLFDIKHQVMTEDNDEINDLLLTEGTDLKKNSYEGGFKVWEGSFDVIDKLANLPKCNSVIELGAGTALPSGFLLFNHFKSQNNGLNLVVSDFNFDVLRLVTLPNLLINWYMARKEPVNEFRVDELLISEFESDLHNFQVNLSFISGSWGGNFLNLVQHTKFDLIITCETIYSPESIPLVADMITSLLQDNSLALVGAKNYYFGVGGSVNEFVSYISNSGVKVVTHEVNSQLKRSIVEVTR